MKTVGLVAGASALPETVVDQRLLCAARPARWPDAHRPFAAPPRQAGDETAADPNRDGGPLAWPPTWASTRGQRASDSVLHQLAASPRSRSPAAAPRWRQQADEQHRCVIDLHNTGCVSFIYMLELARLLMSATDARGSLLCKDQHVLASEGAAQVAGACAGRRLGVGYVAAGGGSPILSVVHRCQPDLRGRPLDGAATGSRGRARSPSRSPTSGSRDHRARQRIVPEMVTAACARRVSARATSSCWSPTSPTRSSCATGVRRWSCRPPPPRHVQRLRQPVRRRDPDRPGGRAGARQARRGGRAGLGGFSHAGDYAAAAVIQWQGAASAGASGCGAASGRGAYRLFDYGSAPAGLIRLDSNESPFAPDDDGIRRLPGRAGRSRPSTATRTSAAGRSRGAGAPLGRRARTRSCSATAPRRSSRCSLTAFGGGTAGGPARVLYPDPTFNQYEALARAYGAEPAAGAARSGSS